MCSVFSMDTANANVIYLDTEFTDLLAPVLLSLGMVSGTGDEHYMELDLESPSSIETLAHVSDFVRHSEVLEQWGRIPGCNATYEQMGQRTAHWLRARVTLVGQPCYIAFDYETDYELFEYLLRDAGQWDAIRELIRPVNVSELTSRLDGALGAEFAYEALLRRGLERHHALADAHALRAACISFTTGKRVQL